MAAFMLITALGGYAFDLIWTGYPGNTLWDWLHLLLIPVGLVAATLFFNEERAWRREWTAALGAAALFLIISALGGYLLNWSWTGFQNNTLWDWFKLLFAPVGLATLSIFFGFKRTWRREWIMALVATIVIFLVVIAGGYLFHWPWTGFAGNTLWDWLKLLLLPVSLVIASFSFKGYERVWMTISAVITTFLLVAVVGGYAFHWTWTGFAGNTLWNWLELLLLPLALTVAEPLFSTYRDEGVSIAMISGVFLLMAAIGGYAFHWTWTGFQNNTLWDWLTLLILPVALVAARISYHPSKDLAANPATGAQHAAGAPATVEPTLSPHVEQVLPVGAEQTLLVNVEQTKSAPVALPQMAEPPIPSERRRRGWRLFTIAAVLLILFISIAGIVVSAHSGSDSSSARTNPIGNTSQTVGTATFFSTPAQQHEPGGMNDGLRLQLQNISAPSYGNLYYAWLQNSQSTPLTIALGTLTVRNGTASLSYVDPHHSDLLELTSTLLITEEAADGTRDSPTLDKQQWRYYGALPQTAASAGQTGFLDNLRHLLSDEPTLDAWGLRGGADVWFQHNLEQIQAATIIVRDHKHLDAVRQQLVDILYYLDGKCATHDLYNVPGPQAPENATVAHDTSASLLDCTQASGTYGLLTNMQKHLQGIAQSPGVTSAQTKSALQVNNELNAIHTWLAEIRSDALALVTMNDAQLTDAGDLRADMAGLANTIINGGIDPTTHALIAGIQPLVSTLDTLAVFYINQYKI